jgi:DNA mismatch repair protein MutL
MKGNFPFFVLNLKLPLDKVDVNVHPNKLEVKFEDSNTIFGMVYSEVLNILYNVNNTKKITTEDEPSVDTSKLQNIENLGSKFELNNYESDNVIKEVSLSHEVEYEQNKIDKELNEFKKNIGNSEGDGFKLVPFITSSSFDFKLNQYKSNNTNLDNFDESEKNSIEEYNSIPYQDEYSKNFTQGYMLDKNNFKIVGTLFDTYILIEQNNSMLVIDQHAGHERLLFDKFTNELYNKTVAVQPLIVPYVLETNYNECVFINDNIDLLSDMGFEIEEFGSCSFKVSSVPLLFDNINLEQFFNNILSDIDNKLMLSKNETIKEYLSKKACRSAVKGNDKLSQNEIDELINRINQPDQVLLCPHGRPIVVDIDKKEIEKWFKRIV